MWEVVEADNPQGNEPDYRVFVTDGSESFHIDRASAQRLADLLNDGAKKVSISKKATK